MTELNLYYFAYKGKALGGEAIVAANTVTEATTLLLDHPDTPNPCERLKVEKIELMKAEPAVLHNWNGDY